MKPISNRMKFGIMFSCLKINYREDHRKVKSKNGDLLFSMSFVKYYIVHSYK